ncbi:MAG: glutaredoxin family protein [Pseudomonadota bacterium]
MKLAPLALLLLSVPAMAGTLYRWTDADGKVHYTDQPPPPTARNATRKTFSSGTSVPPVSTEMQQAALKNPVTLYATATCGEYCERAKAHLARRGIPYAGKDPSTSVDANEELRKGGGQPRVPTLMIGSEKLEGYSEAAWDAALDKAGYPGGKAAPAAPASGEEKQPEEKQP